jgi:hypothetical protein
LALLFASEDTPLKDLVQDGQVALLEAIDRYDFGTGARLSTYANSVVRGVFEKRRGEAAREAVNRGLRDAPFDGEEPVVKKRPRSFDADDEEPIVDDWTDHAEAVACDHSAQKDRFAELRRQLAKDLQPEKVDDEAWSWLDSVGLLEQAQAGTVSIDFLAQQHETWRRSRAVFAHLPDERSCALARIVAHAVSEGSVAERALRAEQVKLLRRWPGILKREFDMASSPQWRQQINREIEKRIRATQPHLQPHKMRDDPAYRTALRADLEVVDRWAAEAVAEMEASPLGSAGLRAFRKRALDDQLIRRWDVERWVEEQADREGPPAQSYLRVPVGDDRAEVTQSEMSPEQVRLAYIQGLERELQRMRDDDAQHPLPEPAQSLSYAEAKTVKIRPDGLLAELKSLASSLAEKLGWREEEAVGFVLSGTWPVFQLRDATQANSVYAAASMVVLEIDPRIDATEVLRLYQKRREALGVVRDGLAMDERSLKLAIFTETNWRPGVRSIWHELREKWRVEHPEDEERLDLGDKHAKKFGRECRRAWSHVTGEDWPRSIDWARRVPAHLRDNARLRNDYLLGELAKERRNRGGSS